MANSFIARAACHGTRPASLASCGGFERPHLVASLVKNRSMVRIIVAPGGYGKTSLAMEYAETMLNWDHCFWMSGESPCFLRDLDACLLASECFREDRTAALLVIDDLPHLDDRRLRLLEKEIEKFQEAECEILITCNPSSDISSRWSLPTVTMSSRDLLLTNEELKQGHSGEELKHVALENLADTERIAALVWGKGENPDTDFLMAALGSEMDSKSLFIAASLLVLKQGYLESLESLGLVEGQDWARLRQDYPHLGISEDLETFEAIPAKVEALSFVLKGRYESMVNTSAGLDRQGLLAFWADELLASGDGRRACEVMYSMNSRKNRSLWLHDHRWDLMRSGCFYSAYLLARDYRSLNGPLRGSMMGIEATCRKMLGDRAGAIRLAQRSLRLETSSLETKAGMACLILRLCPNGDEEAEAMLNQLAAKAQGTFDQDFFNEDIPNAADLVSLGLGLCSDLDSLESTLETLKNSDLFHLGAAWLFSGLEAQEPTMDDFQRPQFPGIIERRVCNHLKAQGSEAKDFILASAGLAMEEAHRRGIAYEHGTLESQVLFGLRQAEMSILAQRHSFEHLEQEVAVKRELWLKTHPVTYRETSEANKIKIAQRVPTLNLRLFGGFSVTVGDRFLGSDEFHRQNSRTLLAILAINQGKEVQKDRLARSMWPHSSMPTAKKNYYTVWSELRKTLALEDGSCPYLVRHQHSCSLDMRYVQSDVVRFSEVCRELLFGSRDGEHWANLFAEIDRDFSTELLPTEKTNALIIQARSEFKARLIDSLVAATDTVTQAGYPQWGIWFARMALRHDETREDAWIALMQSQVACSQRTAAMTTFLKCRKVLDEQLGIDPSAEANALYTMLLESEEGLFVS